MWEVREGKKKGEGRDHEDGSPECWEATRRLRIDIGATERGVKCPFPWNSHLWYSFLFTPLGDLTVADPPVVGHIQ